MRAILLVLALVGCGGALDAAKDDDVADAGCAWTCPKGEAACAVAVLVCEGDQ